MKIVQTLLLSSALALTVASAAQAGSYAQDQAVPLDAYSATYSGRSAFVQPDDRAARPYVGAPRELCGLDIATECGN